MGSLDHRFFMKTLYEDFKVLNKALKNKQKETEYLTGENTFSIKSEILNLS